MITVVRSTKKIEGTSVIIRSEPGLYSHGAWRYVIFPCAADNRLNHIEEWSVGKGNFEPRVGTKRHEGETTWIAMKVPNDILVQRMYSIASRRLKKFEPLDTSDFVLFTDYDDLTSKNVKEACAKVLECPRRYLWHPSLK